MLDFSYLLLYIWVSCMIPSEYETLGTIEMEFKYQFEGVNDKYEILLHSIIKLHNLYGGKQLYNKSDEMKIHNQNTEVVNVSISFDIENISSPLEYEGYLTIKAKNGNTQQHVFNKPIFQYFPKDNSMVKQNSINYNSKSFYTENYKKHLDVLMHGKCKKDYYPDFQCTRHCKKNENSICTNNGEKLCLTGYFLNATSKSCENNLCQIYQNDNKIFSECIKIKENQSCSCMKNDENICKEKSINCEKFLCLNSLHCIAFKMDDNTLSTNSTIIFLQISNGMVTGLAILISIFIFILIFLVILSINLFRVSRRTETGSQKTNKSMDAIDNGDQVSLGNTCSYNYYTESEYVNCAALNHNIQIRAKSLNYPRSTFKISNSELKNIDPSILFECVSETL